MEKEEYLNEEKYKKSNKKVKRVGSLIMLIGLCMIAFAIYTLISASKMEKPIVENKSQTSQDMVGGFLNLNSPESMINWFESSTKSMEEEYQLNLSQMENESQMRRAQMKKQATGMFLLIPGIFVTVVGAMIRFFLGNHREIMAYQVQQVMPVAQEGMEKMAPTVAKVSKNIMEEMAPTYGNLAKEISKGIKEGIDKDATIFCKHCGEEIEADSKFCSNCGKEI